MTPDATFVTEGRASTLATYVPRLLEDHHRRKSSDQLLFATGTLVSADISGFTALSERLSEFGHEGAEELTDLLNRCFTAMIDACEHRGGDIIKFGGDALLVLFAGEDHACDAAIAMSQMHAIVSGSWSTGSVKRVRLGISQGAHSGTFGFSLADIEHLELLVGGPAVSMTVRCEGDAARGEILVSEATANLLPATWLGSRKESEVRALVKRRALQGVEQHAPTDPTPRGLDGLERYLPGALADQVAAGVPGEHRQVVVAFVNLTGTDDLFARDGAEAVNDACQRFGANLREVLGRHPVHLLASDVYVNGTKVILTAGAPVSTDADEDHMLLALRDLFALESPLPIRAGVNRGHVFVGDLGGPTRRTFTVMGDAVNPAARLMQRAKVGQIIVANSVLARAETKFKVRKLAPFTVKGKTEPIRASVLGAAHAVDDDDHLGHLGFIGRHDELARLDDAADQAIDGQGRVVEVIGEAGIGKSRLVRETLQRHPDLRVHRMRGGQYAKNTPFLMVRGLLRTLLELDGDDPTDLGDQLIAWAERSAPELIIWLPLLALPVGAEVGMTSAVERLAEQFRRDRLIAVTADALEIAMQQPTALLAEDVHLFDEGSADTLQALARRAGEHPWFIVGTRRLDTETAMPDAEVIVLDRLSADEARELTTAAGLLKGLESGSRQAKHLETLADRSGGNPLFALELVDGIQESGADALPESIESLVTTRIDLLAPQDRMLLREVAVGGNIVETELLATAFERPELASAERWESLGAFLIQDQPGTFRFRQSLYRDVAYEGLSYRRRREIHRAIGTSLERRRGGSLASITPLLSDHFDRARDYERAWRYSVMAGEAARRTYANNEAVTLFERALRNARDGSVADDAPRGRVAEALGDVHELTGRYPEAVAAYQRGRSWSSEPEPQARLLRKIGAVRTKEGRLSQSLTWLTRARRAIDEIDNERARHLELAETIRLRAGALHRQGRNRLSSRAAEGAAEYAEQTGDRLSMARAFNMVEVAYRTLGRSDAARYSDLALEMYAGTGDLVGEANVLNNRGVRHHFNGHWREAISEYERSRILRQQAGDIHGEAIVANNIGEILSLQRRFDEATDLFEHAGRAWRGSNNSVGVAYADSNLAMVRALSGDPEVGIALLDEATVQLRDLGAASLVSEMAIRRVEVQLLRGQPSDALSLALRIEGRLMEGEGDPQLLVQLLPLLGLAHHRAGDRATSATALNRALTTASEANDQYAKAVTLLAMAELARDRGEAPVDLETEAHDLLTGLDVIGRPSIFPS